MRWKLLKYFLVKFNLISTYDVIFGPKRRFLAICDKKTSNNHFGCLFRPNCWRKSCSDSKMEHFEKKNFFVTLAILDIWRHFWPEKTSFWPYVAKMTSFDPFKCIFRQNCWRKSCSDIVKWNILKKIFHNFRHFWHMTSFFGQKYVYLAICDKNDQFWLF